MPSLLDSIRGQLDGENLQELSRQLGADPSATKGALGSALPLLLGALSKQASTSEGATALGRALDEDHDGGLLEDLTGFLQRGGQTPGIHARASRGDGILSHLLGERRGLVERGIAANAGVDEGLVQKLLPMIAPIVMGALGKQKRQGGLDAASLAGLLIRERSQVEEGSPGAGGFLTSLLDQDGDGDLDLGDLARGVFGKLF